MRICPSLKGCSIPVFLGFLQQNLHPELCRRILASSFTWGRKGETEQREKELEGKETKLGMSWSFGVWGEFVDTGGWERTAAATHCPGQGQKTGQQGTLVAPGNPSRGTGGLWVPCRSCSYPGTHWCGQTAVIGGQGGLGTPGVTTVTFGHLRWPRWSWDT